MDNINKIKDYYDKLYANCDYNEKIDSDLFQYLDLVNPGEVLELGIGLGKNISYLINKGFKITGIDISSCAINTLKKNYPTQNFFVGDIVNYNYGFMKYDVVICSMVLHHLRPRDVKKVTNSIKACLKPGGIVFISALSNRDLAIKGKPHSGVYYDTINSCLSIASVNKYFKNLDTIELNDLFFNEYRGNDIPSNYGIIIYIGQQKVL